MMRNTLRAGFSRWLIAGWIALGVTAPLAAADPPKKPAPSLDDELFQGLDDATKAPGVKPTPSATADKPASSQPTTKPAEQKPAEAKPTGTAAKPAAPPAKSSNPLDDELLKSLGGDEPAPAKKPEANQQRGAKPSDGPPGGDAPETQPSDDPFERLTQQIRDAEKRLRRVDTGEQTQEMQRKIVDDLEKLIAQIEQQQQQQQQQNQSQSQSKPQSQSQPQPKPGEPQQQQRPQSEQDSDQAKDSQEGTRSSKNQKPDPGRLQSLLEKAWGSLPERQRQDVMQSSVDDFPAKYQAVIEEYFKTLLRREE
jgi:hypothetical protein